MKISELSTRSGAPVPTIKYYLREGLLPAGRATGATQADYDEGHLRRIRLIKALTEVAGLPVQRAKLVLGLIDRPDDELFEALGSAIGELPPYLPEADADGEFPRARAALERLGQPYDPRFPAVAQLERALQAVEDAGIGMTEERLLAYGEHLGAMAELDLALMPRDTPAAAIEYAVLGTALYEPVVLALRRLAHQDRAARMLDADTRAPSKATPRRRGGRPRSPRSAPR